MTEQSAEVVEVVLARGTVELPAMVSQKTMVLALAPHATTDSMTLGVQLLRTTVSVLT